MASTSHVRGHPVRWTGEEWVYIDTGEPIDETRPCVRCGDPPSPEGHDACLRMQPDKTSVCCGHGVVEPLQMEIRK